MRRKNKHKYTPILVLFLLFVGFGVCMAIGVYQDGVITQEVWTEGQPRIEIDRVSYTLMPDVKIVGVAKQLNELSDHSLANQFKGLVEGTNVWFQALGHNIYVIQIVPQEAGHEK